MKVENNIPFFGEFSEILAALGIADPGNYRDINVFHYEDAKECTDEIRPYRTAFYQIFFIHHSNLDGNYNDVNIKLKAEHAYLFFACPGKIISWKKSGDLHGFIISFKPSFLDARMPVAAFLNKFRFFGREKNSPFVISCDDEFNKIMELCVKVNEEFRIGRQGSSDIICYYIFILLMTIERFFTDDPENIQAAVAATRNSSLLLKFESLVRKDFNARKTVREYAEILHITPKYLSEILKKERGKTAQQLMYEILMLEARSLLLQTDFSVSEIGHLLGFSDASHFSRVFKSKTGKTPFNFRKK